MTDRQAATFQEALDVIESLPERQQEDLINILQHRLIERRREILAKNIRSARAEYARGEVNTGSVDDIMQALS